MVGSSNTKVLYANTKKKKHTYFNFVFPSLESLTLHVKNAIK